MTKYMIFIVTFLIFVFAPAHAAIVGSSTEKVTIATLYSYSEYGGGDVVFTINTVVQVAKRAIGCGQRIRDLTATLPP